MPYKPRYISSLLRSCYDGEFYGRIVEISFPRALVFLVLNSLLVSLVAVGVLAFFWSRIFPAPDYFLSQYDQLVPDDFQGAFDGEQLEISPSPFELYVGFDSERAFRLSTQPLTEAFAHARIDTERSTEDPPQYSEAPFFAAFYDDGVVLENNFQEDTFAYSDLEFDSSITFDKPFLRVLLESSLPVIEETIKGFLIITGPLILFAYHLLGAFVISLLYSLLGVFVLLIMGKAVDYGLLIKLSFYTSVPALLISLITALLSISVSFIPVFVFSAYYFYGLMAYQPEEKHGSA